MQQVEKRENQRSRLTKTLIVNALLSLLKEKEFNQITVQAICNEAEINRTTFYRYYENQYQLLETIEQELIEELEEHGDVYTLLQNPEARTVATEIMTDFFNCIQNRFDLYHVLVTRVHPNIFEKTRILRTELMIKDLESEMEPYRARYLSDFVVAGGQRIVSEWIAKGEQRESPSLMAQMLIDFLDDRPKSTHTA